MSLPVTIAGMQFQYYFIIAEQITAEAILGLNFLKAHKSILNLACGKILLTDQTVSLMTKTNMCCARVTVTEKLIIPPQNEMEIMVHIHSKEVGTWLIEGVKFKEWPVGVARALVVPRDRVMPVHVVNLNPLLIALYKNTNIAMAELITDKSICTTDDVAENFNTPEPGLVKDVLLQRPLPDDHKENSSFHLCHIILKEIQMTLDVLEFCTIALILRMLPPFDNRLGGYTGKQYRNC